MTVAIVTGASSGIGQSAAVHLAKRGFGVILTYHSNQAGALETAKTIENDSGTAVALPLDAGRAGTFGAFRDDVATALRATWQRDTFDVLVNNAGIAGMAPFADTTEEMFDRLSDVHLKGPYFLTQTLLPLLTDGGAVINVSSNAGTVGNLEPGYSAYATMKGGLSVLSRYMAKELSPRGIRVNAVSPGATRTRFADNAFERYPEVIAPIAAKTALGRVGEPDDIGVFIAALAGAEGRWITGQNIEVSGGFAL